MLWRWSLSDWLRNEAILGYSCEISRKEHYEGLFLGIGLGLSMDVLDLLKNYYKLKLLDPNYDKLYNFNIKKSVVCA